jgi:hypothetical protein
LHIPGSKNHIDSLNDRKIIGCRKKHFVYFCCTPDIL